VNLDSESPGTHGLIVLPDGSGSLQISLQFHLLYDWRFNANQFALAPSPLRLTARDFFQLNTCGHSPYVTSFLTRGWVCRLQLLLALASAVILGSESRGTQAHILLSLIRDPPPTWRARSPYLYPQEQGGPVILPGTGFLFLAFYDSQSYGGGIRTRFQTGINQLQ
jgi:hypothetical protein